MIKKTIYTAALLGLLAIPAMAQTTEPQETAANDSLQQTINALEEEKKQLEEEALNKKIWNDRAKYFNISYAKQSLSMDMEGEKCTWNNNLGAAITWGRTYYLHKKPILGMIKFGLDWSFLDINFAMYEDKFGALGDEGPDGDGGYGSGNYYNPSEEYPGLGYIDDNFGNGDYDSDYYEEGPTKMYQAEFGMQFGPSLTINPINHLKINGYFRVTPSYSVFYNGDDVFGSYGTFFSLGGAISYKAISLGVEGRWGNTKYKSMMGEEGSDGDDYGNDYGYEESYNEPTPKYKIGTTRIYISFRF